MLMTLYPSTSSGRAQRSHGLVFTAELVEASGRARRGTERIEAEVPSESNNVAGVKASG